MAVTFKTFNIEMALDFIAKNSTESTCILHSASCVNNLPNHIIVIKYRKLTFSPSILVSFPCSRVYNPGSHFAVSKNSFIFKSSFRFIAKRSGKYKEFPYSICPPPRASYTINISLNICWTYIDISLSCKGHHLH